MSVGHNCSSVSVKQITNFLRHTKLDKYLFLPGKPFPNLESSEADYIILLPPTNSSGDIYHFTTYLMLSQHEKKSLSYVHLSYDKDETSRELENEINTSPRVQRYIQFAEYFGFQEVFLSPIRLNNDCYRENPPYAAILTHLQKNHNQRNNCYIEKKLVTNYINI